MIDSDFRTAFELAPIGLVISRLELVVPPLRLPLKGRITLGDQFSIDASLATGTVSVSSLPDWVYRSGFEAGNLEVSMDVKGSDAEWKNWRAGGWLALTNGLMTLKGVDGAVEAIRTQKKRLRHSKLDVLGETQRAEPTLPNQRRNPARPHEQRRD